MSRTVRTVETRHGPARLHRLSSARGGAATIVLGHGAGGGVEAVDLRSLGAALGAAGFAIVLVEQPWRVAGRRVAPSPSVLDEGWLDAVRALRPRGPLVVGGRSAGARVACRTASDLGAVGVLALAFPLHPPGRPERSRVGELAECPVPTVVVQGDSDPFGSAAEIVAWRLPIRVVEVAGGDHGLSRADLSPAVAEVAEWLAMIDPRE